MGITFVNPHALQAGTTGLTMIPPAAAAGDIEILWTANKPSTADPTDPAGFQRLGSNVVGTGTTGPGTGPLRLTTWWRELTGTPGNTAITDSSATIIFGGGMIYRRAAAEVWNVPVALWGSDTAEDTTFSAAVSGNASCQSGDWLVAVGVFTLNTGLPGRGITLPGCTAAYTAINSGGQSFGNGLFMWTDHEQITGGTQTAPGVTIGSSSAATTGGTLQIKVALAPPTGTATPGSLPVASATAGSMTVPIATGG